MFSEHAPTTAGLKDAVMQEGRWVKVTHHDRFDRYVTGISRFSFLATLCINVAI